MKAKLKKACALALPVVGGAFLLSWYQASSAGDEKSIVLHGNVDLRQVDLPFNAQQRVAEMLVEEGDRVTVGQVIARLDTSRLNAALADASARVESQKKVVERLENGTRSEEIEQARANLAAAESEKAISNLKYDRMKSLIGTGAAADQEIDESRMALETASARAKMYKEALDMALAGPRVEEIAEAKSSLLALEAQLNMRQIELNDAELRSPVNGIVRSRIMEPGEMCSPGAPAVTLAITDPKWVRGYINEVDLGKVKNGTKAAITVDAFSGKSFEGWVGFISPVAEFTPKNVETEELRTSLMYEVRVFFNDPQDALRLGMPTTVSLKVSSSKD